jgi:nucleoside-diphosphate-sugar epimerase
MARAQRVLGYEARVSLEDGLRATWNWFAARAACAPATTMPVGQPA